MSLVFKSLSGLDTIAAGQLANSQRLTLITAQGLVNATWGTLSDAISGPLNTRLDAVEEALAGASGPSIWPTARTITLTGAVTGSVAIDGSKNVSLATTIADGSLAQAKVTGLVAKLDELGTATNNRWGTGYTTGAYATSYGGNLDTLAGATFLYTQTGATNVPDALSNGQFVILQNGPQNFGQQIALRKGEGWIRGQDLGAWGSWNKLWTSANLDPSTLLLKTDTATAASKLATARTIALTGLVTATGTFDGSANLSLATSIADGAITIAKVSGLQTALDSKFGGRGRIAAGTALNTVQAPGYYGQDVLSEVTTANNYPVTGVGGSLTVTQFNGYNVQIYVTTTNQYWHRTYDGSSWSAWARSLSSTEFDPSTKYDKSGGTISGAVNVTGSLTVNSTSTSRDFVSTVAPTTNPLWLLSGAGYTGRARGIRMNEDYVALTNMDTSGGNATYDLRLSNGGLLELRTPSSTLKVYHSGNFDPANPVPTDGILNIGDPGSNNLRLRKDGSYSIDGGTNWAQFGGTQEGTDPRFHSLRIGDDNDIYLYEDLSGQLAVRTGSSVDYRYFMFGSDGNFQVPNGRVMISGNEAWHAGNFNPATKLNTTATAAAATKLATARTINGVAFDGTANITITAAATIPDNPVITGRVQFDVNNGSTAMAWLREYGANGITFDAANQDNSAYAPLNFAATTLTFNNQAIWYAGNFNPASKANANNASFTGTVVSTSGSFRAQGWGSDANGGVLYLGADDTYLYRTAGRFEFKNAAGGFTATLNAGGTIHTTGNFDPASKLNARPSLDTSCASHTDWNNATNNGWWMANGAANAPGGSTDWFLGVVTVHNGDWIQQEVHRFTEGGFVAGAKWYRWKRGGTWGPWTQDLIVGGALSANRMASGWDSGNAGSISCSNWFRTTGNTGIYFSDYGGGVYMQDTTYVRTYNNKAMAATWFEVNGPVHNPQAAANQAAFRAYGNYGGGYGLIDGGAHISIYSVGGNLNFGFGTGSVAGKASIQADGTFYGTDYAINSDATLKTEIGAFRYNGPLRPVHFEWIASGLKDFGFIAQDVQEKYPEAVEVDPQTGKLRLKQAKLTAVLAAQANTQGDEIAALQRDVAELKALVAELRNR